MTPRLWLIALLLVPVAPGHAQPPPPRPPPHPPVPPAPARGALPPFFGDWYDNLAGNPTHVYDPSGNDLGQANIDGKNPITRDLNGIQLRRVYFQVDNELSI